jgi:hypothetical protein
LDTLASPNCEAGFRGAGLLGSVTRRTPFGTADV